MSKDTLPTLGRRIFQGAYYLLVVGFVATVGYAATKGAFWPDSKTGTAVAEADPSECQANLMALHNRSFDAAFKHFRLVGQTTASETWHDASQRWRSEYKELVARCGLTRRTAPAQLRQTAKNVDRVHTALDTGLRAFRNIAKRPLSQIGDSGAPGLGDGPEE